MKEFKKGLDEDLLMTCFVGVPFAIVVILIAIYVFIDHILKRFGEMFHSIVSPGMVSVCGTIIVIAGTLTVVACFLALALRVFNRSRITEINSDNAIVHGRRPVTPVSFKKDGGISSEHIDPRMELLARREEIRKATWNDEDLRVLREEKKKKISGNNNDKIKCLEEIE
ncbi:MAG: hypothetical protein PVI90_15310 [Desulfobacteraceae bacterium]